MDETPSDDWGLGERTSNADINLYGRAMRERWDMSDDRRMEIMRELADAATNKKIKLRVRINAIRVLLAADKLNLDYQKDTRENESGQRTVRDVTAEALERLANHVPAEPPAATDEHATE